MQWCLLLLPLRSLAGLDLFPLRPRLGLFFFTIVNNMNKRSEISVGSLPQNRLSAEYERVDIVCQNRVDDPGTIENSELCFRLSFCLDIRQSQNNASIRVLSFFKLTDDKLTIRHSIPNASKSSFVFAFNGCDPVFPILLYKKHEVF